LGNPQKGPKKNFHSNLVILPKGYYNDVGRGEPLFLGGGLNLFRVRPEIRNLREVPLKTLGRTLFIQQRPLNWSTIFRGDFEIGEARFHIGSLLKRLKIAVKSPLGGAKHVLRGEEGVYPHKGGP